MKPLTDGYYLSEQFHTEEMHAGVRIQDSFYRFIKFFSDGFWLWSDRNSEDFDFLTFIHNFDLKHWRANHKLESPPTSTDRDGGHVFQFGTYVAMQDATVVSIYSPIAEMEFLSNITIEDDGKRFRGWKHVFLYCNHL